MICQFRKGEEPFIPCEAAKPAEMLEVYLLVGSLLAPHRKDSFDNPSSYLPLPIALVSRLLVSIGADKFIDNPAEIGGVALDRLAFVALHAVECLRLRPVFFLYMVLTHKFLLKS